MRILYMDIRRLLPFCVVLLMALLAGCTTEAERLRMCRALDSINALNRSSQPFTVQDVEPLVAYFDRHGTSDNRVLAHYLLGRAHHEHGEAPAALQCYHDALDCVDTTRCDFALLSRVYGQMAKIHCDQGLYR
jgi:cytochrome c-type biogenesis protein CcmH/NrfG